MLESPSHITKNLRRVFDSATNEQYDAGILWYRVAFGIAKDFAVEFDQLVWTVTRVIAGLSPQCSWERNLVRVREYFEKGHSPGLPLAERGLKVQAFANSIFLEGRTTQVCVDRHMIAASLPLTASIDDRTFKKVFDSAARVRRIQRAVQLIAAEEGIWPAQAQAIIWVVQRGKGESQTKNRSRLQQVRSPVRGVGIRRDSGRGKDRGPGGGLVEQRLDDRPLPRRRRTQRIESHTQEDPQGKEKKKHSRKPQRGGGQARKRGSRTGSGR